MMDEKILIDFMNKYHKNFKIQRIERIAPFDKRYYIAYSEKSSCELFIDENDNVLIVPT